MKQVRITLGWNVTSFLSGSACVTGASRVPRLNTKDLCVWLSLAHRRNFIVMWVSEMQLNILKKMTHHNRKLEFILKVEHPKTQCSWLVQTLSMSVDQPLIASVNILVTPGANELSLGTPYDWVQSKQLFRSGSLSVIKAWAIKLWFRCWLGMIRKRFLACGKVFTVQTKPQSTNMWIYNHVIPD